MSAPSGYYSFKINSLDANGINFYFSSQGGGNFFNAQLFTSSGATLISWPNLLMGNESLAFHGLVQPGQSYVLALQGNNDPQGYVYQTNISIPANAAPPTTPFVPGITGGGTMSTLNVQATVSWNTDGTGVAQIQFPTTGTNGIAQVYLNGQDVTGSVNASADLLNLPGGTVTVQIPLGNQPNTVQIKTGGNQSWSASFNSPGPKSSPSSQSVTGNPITTDYTLLGITLPGYGWGIAGILGYLGFRKVFRK